VGYRFLGATQVLMGQNRDALESLRRAERDRAPGRQKLLSPPSFGIDPNLAVLSYKRRALLLLGLHDQAARVGEQVRIEIGSYGHAPTVAACTLHSVVWPDLMFGELEACQRHAPNSLPIVSKKK
jgi:hypothetical protein